MRQIISALSMVFILLGAGLSGGCSASGPITLPPGEITAYQGEQLGSVADFRENSIKGPQHVNIDTYRLQITGLVARPREYRYNDVLSRQAYEKVLTIDCVEGWSVKTLWEGVLLAELLAEAGPLPAATSIIFHAADGYTTSFPVSYIMQNDILLAYKINAITLPPERGYPFALVAESKWGYKWIRWITEIEFSAGTDYRGFWESRGYANSGDMDKPFFGP